MGILIGLVALSLSSTVFIVGLLAMSPPTEATSPAEAQPITEQPQPAPLQPQPAPLQPQPAPLQPQPPMQPQPAPGQLQPQPPMQPQPAPGQLQPVPMQPQPAPGQLQPVPGGSSLTTWNDAPPPSHQSSSSSSSSESRGIGMLVLGPMIIGFGVPFAFLGHAFWRSYCGPTETYAECQSGSVLSGISHGVAGVAFGAGIMFVGFGGRRLGVYNRKRMIGSNGLRAERAGSVLLPLSLVGIGAARLAFFIPAPHCEEWSCVEILGSLSAGTVSTFSVLAATGAGLLMYGRARGIKTRYMLVPHIGLQHSGLSVVGRF